MNYLRLNGSKNPTTTQFKRNWRTMSGVTIFIIQLKYRYGKWSRG